MKPHMTWASSHPERDLEVLPAPHVHPLVVRSHLEEVLPVCREQAPSHRRGSVDTRYI